MSNGFMVDPIKPGNKTTSGALNGGDYRNKQSANNFAIVVVVVLVVILFIVPFIGSFIFIKMVKEDFFGPILEGKIERSFWIHAIFFLLIFGLGVSVGLTIGGNAL